MKRAKPWPSSRMSGERNQVTLDKRLLRGKRVPGLGATSVTRFRRLPTLPRCSDLFLYLPLIYYSIITCNIRNIVTKRAAD